MFDTMDWDVELAAGELDQPDTDPGLSDVDEDRHVLPVDLESIPPGNFPAAILSAVDVSLLSGYDLVRYVQAQERLVSHYQAAYYQGVAELACAVDAGTTVRGPVNEFVSDELSAALSKTRRAAEAEVDLALDLKRRIPQVWGALCEGRVDIRRARIFARETATLGTTLIPQVVDPLLAEAAQLTTGQLRSRLAKKVIEADPTAAEAEYQAGLEDRKLVAYPNPDHTANIGMFSVDPVQANAARSHIHDLALKLKRLPGETRTLDQIKADIALDLLQGKTTNIPESSIPPKTKVVVQITSSSPTGHITGYGPVLVSQLPKTADNIQLDNRTSGVAKDDSTGDSECHETASRTPTKAQVEHIHQTYPTCICPGCRMPAERCDIDHRTPRHKGGKTTCSNLAPLCRHHHRCKDEGGWKLQRNPDGSHTWTSPLGHTYTTRAPP